MNAREELDAATVALQQAKYEGALEKIAAAKTRHERAVAAYQSQQAQAEEPEAEAEPAAPSMVPTEEPEAEAEPAAPSMVPSEPPAGVTLPNGAYWNGERYVAPGDPRWSSARYEKIAGQPWAPPQPPAPDADESAPTPSSEEVTTPLKPAIMPPEPVVPPPRSEPTKPETKAEKKAAAKAKKEAEKAAKAAAKKAKKEAEK